MPLIPKGTLLEQVEEGNYKELVNPGSLGKQLVKW